MKIQYSRSAVKSLPLIMTMAEGLPLASLSLFKSFSPTDKQYLKKFTSRAPLQGDFLYPLILPSGRQLTLLGIGDRKKFNHRKAIIAIRRAVAAARQQKMERFQLSLEDFLPVGDTDIATFAELFAVQLEMANYEFVKYKQKPKEGWTFVDSVSVIAPSADFQKALDRGQAIGKEINRARDLANTPAEDMTPEILGQAARDAAKGTPVEVKILDENQMKKLGMGAVLAVGQGSIHRPKFIVMEYRGAPPSDNPVVLVGKGVTFDSGGLSLKPGEHMMDMYMDMTGGASVIHTITALARLKIKKNIVALIPAVENLPSGSSYHPGDLVRTLSGKTIEVLNTDAEGRVILSDALTYSARYKPELVIDVATLTGAAMMALGFRASAIFTTDTALEFGLRESGEATGDFVWPLPLWEEYESEVKGTFGDVANMGKYQRYGGAIIGAVFLWQFIKDTRWVHIDIAPRMQSVEGDYLAKGATGAAVYLLVHFLRNR